MTAKPSIAAQLQARLPQLKINSIRIRIMIQTRSALTLICLLQPAITLQNFQQNCFAVQHQHKVTAISISDP